MPFRFSPENLNLHVVEQIELTTTCLLWVVAILSFTPSIAFIGGCNNSYEFKSHLIPSSEVAGKMHWNFLQTNHSQFRGPRLMSTAVSTDFSSLGGVLHGL